MTVELALIVTFVGLFTIHIILGTAIDTLRARVKALEDKDPTP